MNFRRIKSFISMLIVFSMLITAIPAVFASDEYSKYTDFPTGWSKAAMEYAVDNGLLYGRSDSTINPQDNLTRAEMAAIINRMFGAKVEASITKYTDVSKSDWFYNDIAKAVNMRTFIGDSATTMNPNENITREAVFTVVARALVLETEDYTALDAFPDGNKVSDWAKSATSILLEKGYIHGNDKGEICPTCYITREEFAQIMYNIVKTYYVEEGKYTTTGEDSSVIRTTGVTLENVTIDGDLIIGDGVGYGTVNLRNVTINGRLLCRGGEKGIKLTNTKVKEYVVVYDVNGIVHFENYRTDSVFKNIKEITDATFLVRPGGGSGSSSGGQEKQYYTVSFHNGSDPAAFTTLDIDKSYDSDKRNLSYLNKTLDGIYASYISSLPAYDREALGESELGVTYEHQVDKEYIYEETPGVWKVFTEDTTVSKNIDVYYAAKHALIEVEVSSFSTPYSVELRYDSESRVMDSVKDALITLGMTLDKNVVKNEINGKIENLYNSLNNETGMIDSEGNIINRDYGMKIVSIIPYEDIQSEVKTYIKDMLVPEKGDVITEEEKIQLEENIESMVSIFGIDTLVKKIGVKNLVNLIGEESLRTILKDEALKGYIGEIIVDEITGDEEGTLITTVLETDAKDSIIDSAASDNAFISKLIPQFSSNVITILKTGEVKTALLAYLENDDIKAEILGRIKADEGFKEGITITDTDNEGYEASIALRKVLLAEVAEPGNVYIEDESVSVDSNGFKAMSAGAKKVREVILSVIEDLYGENQKKTIANTRYLYEAIIQSYTSADGKHSFGSGVRVTPALTRQIDEALAGVINKYFSTNAGEALDSEMKAIIDNAIMGFAKNYVNGNKINTSLEEVIETHIINFLVDYFAGTIDLSNVDGIEDFATKVKAEVIKKVKTADVNVLKQPIIDFVTNPDNVGEVGTIVTSNYDILVGNIEVDELKGYILTMLEEPENPEEQPDEPTTAEKIETLIIEKMDEEAVIGHVSGMTKKEREALASEILTMLESDEEYSEFMGAFGNKKDSFVINKNNIHFVEAICKAIEEFTFDEILGFLINGGFEPIINLLGEDYVETLFNDATGKYCEGLRAKLEEVNNSQDENYETSYTTSMNVKIEIPLILNSVYDKYADNFVAKIEGNGIYDYDKNDALKKFVNLDWFDLLIGYDKARVNATTGASGYYFREYMDYYRLMVDATILYDDALCFYDIENYDDEEFKEVKESLTSEILAFVEKLESLSDLIKNDQAIAGGYTLQDLIDKVDSINAMLGSSGEADESQASAIQSAVSSVKEILVSLGEGNLPNGSSLEDLTVMCGKIKNVIKSMNKGEYESINSTFEELIASAMDRLDAAFDEMAETGKLPAESILSRFSVFDKIYGRFASQIKNVISAVANLDLGSLGIEVDSEKFEDVIFGREEEDIFNFDSFIEIIKGQLGTSKKSGYDEKKQIYVIDEYSKEAKGNNIKLQRRFY